MKRSVQGISMVWLLFTVCIWGQGLLAQTANGYIQVKCEAGVKVFLDGTFKGIATSDVGGLIIQDVSEGIHEIRTVRDGFMPQSKSFMIDAGQVFVYNVEPFTPAIEIKESGAQGLGHISRSTGIVIIQSLPVECRINIPGMGLSNSQKRRDRWIVDKVPEGEYSASFVSAVGRLNHKFTVRGNDTTRFMVNFMEKKVIALSYWDLPEGKVHIHSNNTGFKVFVDDLKYRNKKQFTVPHMGSFKSSDYKLVWNDFNKNEVDFKVLPGKTTDIFIPFKQALLPMVTVSDHAEYINEKEYLKYNCDKLSEGIYKEITKMIYKRKISKWMAGIGFTATVIGLLIKDLPKPDKNDSDYYYYYAVEGPGLHFDDWEYEHDVEEYNKRKKIKKGWLSAGLVSIAVSIPLALERVKAWERDENNIRINNEQKLKLVEKYTRLKEKWTAETDAKNEAIKAENGLIEKENAALGEAVVQVR